MATLFHGGTLFDGEQYVGAAQVLVADGRIAAVSTGDAAGQPLDAPAGTRVVDLEGGLLAPGFVDAHVHVVQGGLERVRCDLSGLDGREVHGVEIAHRVRRPAVGRPTFLMLGLHHARE